MTTQELIETTKLMEANRADIVTALNAVGIEEANESTPLSKLAELIKWATGFGCCDIAVKRKQGYDHAGEYGHFTAQEWKDLGNSGRWSEYNVLGLLFRAEGKQWIISAADVGNTTYAWCSVRGVVTNLKQYDATSVSTGFLDDFGYYRPEGGTPQSKTDRLLLFAETRTETYPAVTAARAYKAWESESDPDTLTWNLPDVSIWHMWVRYKTEINAALTNFFGKGLTSNNYWTVDEVAGSSAGCAWCIEPSGAMLYGYKDNSYCVRACAEPPAMTLT